MFMLYSLKFAQKVNCHLPYEQTFKLIYVNKLKIV